MGHLDHRLARGRGAVDGLLVVVEGDTGGIQLGNRIGDGHDASAAEHGFVCGRWHGASVKPNPAPHSLSRRWEPNGTAYAMIRKFTRRKVDSQALATRRSLSCEQQDLRIDLHQPN